MKSKHFRKDVILARVIAGLLLIVLIALIAFAISLFEGPSGSDKDSQNSQNTQNSQVNPGTQDTGDTQETEGSQSTEDTQGTEDTQQTENSENESQVPEKKYVKTTTQVRLRKEPNTNCATLDRINGGTVLEVEETLDGWYKVTYNGKTGYVSADYAKVVEQQ